MHVYNYRIPIGIIIPVYIIIPKGPATLITHGKGKYTWALRCYINISYVYNILSCTWYATVCDASWPASSRTARCASPPAVCSVGTLGTVPRYSCYYIKYTNAILRKSPNIELSANDGERANIHRPQNQPPSPPQGSRDANNIHY